MVIKESKEYLNMGLDEARVECCWSKKSLKPADCSSLKLVMKTTRSQSSEADKQKMLEEILKDVLLEI